MKKIITLLFLVGAVASASAQSSPEDARRVIFGKRSGSGSTTERTSGSDPRDVIFGGDRRSEESTRYPNGTYGTREQQIDQVNREYDRKIYSIRNNPNLSSAEKERMIRQLENDRARRIREINGYNRDDRNYSGKKVKSNNGNHYGWEKGKGNPHRSDGNYSKGNGKSKGNGNGKSKGKN